MTGRQQGLTSTAIVRSVKYVTISTFCKQHEALICMPVPARGASANFAAMSLAHCITA